MASSPPDQVSELFEKAKTDFLKEIKDPKLRSQLEATTTIDDVWDYTEKLQQDQANNRRLRGMRKIGPYIERLQEYAGVIQVFVQVKPDILGLIWGPIKLLLQISSNLVKSFDAILDVMKTLGPILPRFNEFIPLFKSNERMKYVLGLFFQDILDFYLVSLKFFALTRWKVFFESLWPARRAEIEVIAQNIEKHRLLLCNEITLSDILEAHTSRQKALEHYAQTREFQERQDFHSMENYIRPPSYDQDLDRLHTHRCEGTGNWLLKHGDFVKWIERKNNAPQAFWLQGIPGAGKTFLASTAVDKAKELGHSLFAFLSYRKPLESTLPVLHSLLFQLASQDRDLRAVLCNSILTSTKDLKRDLKGDSKFALETLVKLLKAAGSTYITIDGLDEITEGLQNLLLHQLVEVLKECSDVKLFVSSRREDKIHRKLGQTALTLCINQNNVRCIKTYTDRWIKVWLDDSDFDDDARSEIQQLLSPLGEKAQGMFLYAKIVLESVEMLQDLESIRKQLNVLPESLDEAYGRILHRIEKLPQLIRDQSKTIFSWAACSPVEVTRREMEQALLIRAESRTIPRVQSTLNTLKICGPLVEIQDESVRFVHFTVKEYLLDHPKNTFVNREKAILDISTTCLAYLCSDALDPRLSDDELSENLLSGHYRLLHFAQSQWAECVRDCVNLFEQDLPSQIFDLLEEFSVQRANWDYDQAQETNPKLWGFDKFQDHPDSCETVSRALDFRRLLETSHDWRLDQDNDWIERDPSTLSSIVQRLHGLLEGLLCPDSGHGRDCRCSDLLKHYGSRVYRCSFVSCPYFQTSFETRTPRDQHLNRHNRPFKCDVAGCEYSGLGFSTWKQYEKHRTGSHPQPRSDPVDGDLDKLSKDDKIRLLLDLIVEDQVDRVAGLVSFIDMGNAAYNLWRFVGAHGSLTMAQLADRVFPNGEKYLHCAVKEAAAAANIEVFALLAPYTTSLGWVQSITTSVVNCRSEEIFNIWSDCLLSDDKNSPATLFLLTPKRPNPHMEARLAEFWIQRRSLGKVSKLEAGRALKLVSKNCCSVVLAKALVTCGAEVNYRVGRGARDPGALTPLHCAAKKTTMEAAYLIEFLLLSGADPDTEIWSGRDGRKRYTPSMEPGAKGISKWLGRTWDELVEWAARERQAQGLPRVQPASRQ